jgi:hypothetical protein
MVEGDVNPYPITLLVNFWEIRPSQMGPKLDELLRHGVTQFASFVPWQVAEADIHHTLTRFLQAVAERRMKIFLILSPEVGIHYPYSGLPKDIVARKESVAQDCQQGKIPVHLPPGLFHLPSLFAPDFTKRYSSFLGRLDNLFYDFEKLHPSIMRSVRAVVTGSFWKYYRSSCLSSQSAFGGAGGDFSPHAALSYRQRIESHYSQREFTDPTPAAANRWKTRPMEDVNRRWFYQQAEDQFRHRTRSMILKKCAKLPVSELELYTPEADPSMTYSNFLQMVSGGHVDFGRLSQLIDEASLRTSVGAESTPAPTLPFIHWTSMGGFRLLAEAEKQFLILKSLLLLGGEGGGILIDESEWFSLSNQFRNRAEYLARSLTQKEFLIRNRVLYLVPHLWSSHGSFFEELTKQVASGLKVISTLDLALRENFSQLLMVDPKFIITREMVQKLTAWAKAGRVVVIPRSTLYTESARLELESILNHTPRIDVNLGVSYHLHALGDGKFIIYDMPTHSASREASLAPIQAFLTSMLSIAEIENYCRVGDSRLSVIPFERKNNEVAIFVLNGNRRQITADLIFPSEVGISDLGAIFTGNTSAHHPGAGADAGAGTDLGTGANSSQDDFDRANRFTLDVPPFGVLPLSVRGLSLTELRERQIAAMTSEDTQKNALKAALSELPGFDPTEEGLEDLWN